MHGAGANSLAAATPPRFWAALQAQRRPPHHIPKDRYWVQNWSAYEAGLKRRDDLTLWIDEDALTGWQTPRRAALGSQVW